MNDLNLNGGDVDPEARVDFNGGQGAGLSWPQLGSIVSAATATRSGVSFESAIRCRRVKQVSERAPGEAKRCLGFLLLRRSDLPREIRWRCRRCAAAGVVLNWKGALADLTPWLRSSLEERGEAPSRLLSLPIGEFEAAARSHALDRRSQLILFRGRRRGRGVKIEATAAELLYFQDQLVADANCEPAGARRRRLYRLFDRIERILAALAGSVHRAPMPPLSRDPMGQRASWQLLRSLEARARELTAAAELDLGGDGIAPVDFDELKERLSHEPLPELGGLSFAQLGRLMDGEALAETKEDGKGRPSGVVRWNEELPLEEVSRAPMLRHYLLLLAAVRDENLARSSEARSLEKRLAELEREGLVRRRAGSVRLTTDGKRFLDPSRAGELYARVLRSRLRLASPTVMDGALYALFALTRPAPSWQPLEPFLERLVLPLSAPGESERRLRAIRIRLLPVLEDLALVECRRRAARIMVRKTTLADRIASFELGGTLPSGGE